MLSTNATNEGDVGSIMVAWTPRRSLAAVVGHLHLMVAIALIISGTVAGIADLSLWLFPPDHVMALGMTVAIVGANWFNLAYWYPVAWTTGTQSQQRAISIVFTKLHKMLIRYIILLQFWGCSAIIVLDILATVVPHTSVTSSLDASPIATLFADVLDMSLMLFTLPALLGGIFNYLLAKEAGLLPSSVTANTDADHLSAGMQRERAAWYGELGVARETYKIVIASLVFFAAGLLAADSKQVLIVFGGAVVAILLMGAFLWYTGIEVRHLLRMRTR